MRRTAAVAMSLPGRFAVVIVALAGSALSQEAPASRAVVSVVLVAGRLVTPEGKPVEASIVARVPRDPADAAAREGPPASAWSDREGRFEIGVAAVRGALPARTLWLEVDDGPREKFRRERRVEVTLAGATPDGRIDVGDVVVRVPPPLAAGRVRDPDGNPVPDAMVALVRRRGGEWVPEFENRIAAHSGNDGRFRLRGRADRRDLGLVATKPGWICLDPSPLGPESPEVELVLRKAGGLLGSIRGIEPGPSWSSGPVKVMLSGPGARLVARDRGGPLRDDVELPLVQPVPGFESQAGRFMALELAPGTYSVRFVAAGVEEPLVAIDGIKVGAEVIREPRLADVDVGRFLSRRTVTVVDEQREPLAHVRIGARPAKDPAAGYAVFTTDPDGRATVTMPPGPLELVAARRWYRPEVLADATGDVTMTLAEARPLPVAILLADGTASPPAPYSLEVELAFVAAAGQTRPPAPIPSDPRNNVFDLEARLGRSAALTVPAPGLYEVRLWLSKERAARRDRMPIAQAGGSNATVSVSAESLASVTISPDPAAFRRALERWTE